MSSEDGRRALLAHVVSSGRIAALSPFAAELTRFALLVVGPDAIETFAKRPEAAGMLVRGHLGRVSTPAGIVDLVLLPRAWVEGAIGELSLATAPPVGFGEVRVVVLAADGFTFGTVAIAPSTRGVLA